MFADALDALPRFGLRIHIHFKRIRIQCFQMHAVPDLDLNPGLDLFQFDTFLKNYIYDISKKRTLDPDPNGYIIDV